MKILQHLSEQNNNMRVSKWFCVNYSFFSYIRQILYSLVWYNVSEVQLMNALAQFLLLFNHFWCALIKHPVSTSVLSMAHLYGLKCVIPVDECSPLFFCLKPSWNHTADQRTDWSLQRRLGQLQRIREQLWVRLGQREQFQWQWMQPNVPRCHTRGTHHFTSLKYIHKLIHGLRILQNLHKTALKQYSWCLSGEMFRGLTILRCPFVNLSSLLFYETDFKQKKLLYKLNWLSLENDIFADISAQTSPTVFKNNSLPLL